MGSYSILVESVLLEFQVVLRCAFLNRIGLGSDGVMEPMSGLHCFQTGR